MSKFEVHRVTCPDCGHAQVIDIYVSISADRMSEATDRLIGGSWERFACDSCGHPFVIDNRLLYTTCRTGRVPSSGVGAVGK